MSTVGKDMARGCGRAMIIRVIAIAIGFPLGCALVVTPLWLVTTFDLPPWLLLVSAGLFLLLMFGGAGASFGIVLYRRKQMLDVAFCPLGLEGKAYLSFFRQYHGTINDRQVDVYLARGPLLQIEVGTSLQTRLGVTGAHGDTRFLAGLTNQSTLPVADPSLTVFPHDEGWTRALFDNPYALEIFKRLTALESTFTRQQVILRPGTFQLLLSGNTQMLGFKLDPAQTQVWVNDLLRLAHVAERLPAPTVTAELSSLEQSAYRIRQANPYLTLWIALGTVGFFVIVAIVVAIFVAILTSLD